MSKRCSAGEEYATKGEFKMTDKIIIQQGNRRAEIDGAYVKLLRLRNKRKPEGVWPEVCVPDKTGRLYAAHAWALKGCIDDEVLKH